jgi:hypothetical protein
MTCAALPASLYGRPEVNSGTDRRRGAAWLDERGVQLPLLVSIAQSACWRGGYERVPEQAAEWLRSIEAACANDVGRGLAVAAEEEAARLGAAAHADRGDLDVLGDLPLARLAP